MKIFQFIIKSGIAAFILLFSFALPGASITSMEIVPVENQKVFLLSVKTTGSGDINMRIKNSKGQVIFSDQHHSLSSFEKRINLDELRNGAYTFELEDEFLVNITPFTIDPTGFVVEEENSSQCFKPIIKWDSDNQNLDIHWLLKENGTIRITIKDDEAKIYHRSNIKNQLIFQKRYNLKNIETGKYQMTVVNRDRTYTKKFEIR